jgi:hypothetical protein
MFRQILKEELIKNRYVLDTLQTAKDSLKPGHARNQSVPFGWYIYKTDHYYLATPEKVALKIATAAGRVNPNLIEGLNQELVDSVTGKIAYLEGLLSDREEFNARKKSWSQLVKAKLILNSMPSDPATQIILNSLT